MRFDFRRHWAAGSLALLFVAAPVTVRAAAPKVEDALKLAPVQSDVEYDRPVAADAAQCTIKSEKIGDQSGWVVRNATPNAPLCRHQWRQCRRPVVLLSRYRGL